MDRKTLEYMEERARKARKIVNRIEELNKSFNYVEKAEMFSFRTVTHGNYMEEKERGFVQKMKAACLRIMVEEVERLEQDLAEL